MADRPTVDDPDTKTTECWRCGEQRYIFETCHHCGGSCKPHTKKKQQKAARD